MKIAVYSRHIDSSNFPAIKYFFSLLEKHQIDYSVFENLKKEIQPELSYQLNCQSFSTHKDIKQQRINFLISLGGDGTFLDTLTYIRNSGVPVMGINTGRLGFLANIPEKKIEVALQDLLNDRYSIENRTLLYLKSNKPAFKEGPYALNDFTIHKRDNASMITINTYLNGELFNTYWADGLVVATPTGSTAYSLSCGGPIIFPGSKTFILTPVAPHHLNIRPIIVSDNAVLSFEIKGRGANFLVSLDSKSEILDYSYQLAIYKAPFKMRLIKLKRQNFVYTLREKLMWGLDNRND